MEAQSFTPKEWSGSLMSIDPEFGALKSGSAEPEEQFTGKNLLLASVHMLCVTSDPAVC